MRTAITLLLIVLALPALAADEALPEFDVEVIVFRHVNPDTTEHRMVEEEPDDVDAEPVTRRRYPPIAPGDLGLDSVVGRLMRSESFSPVLHAGWRQPGESREEAAAMSVAGTGGGASAAGTVRLSLERFLHLEIDLTLDGGADGPHRLLQGRRMRSGEIHYFDHPQFGVIAVVNRAPSP